MKLRFVKTAGRKWRFGPWPISYGWGFDLGRWRLVYGTPETAGSAFSPPTPSGEGER